MELFFSEGVAKNKITLNKYVEVACTNPAKILACSPQGTIAVGSDADIVIFDPNEKHTISAKTHHMNVDYSGYEGWSLPVKWKQFCYVDRLPLITINALFEKGYGKFIKRNKVSQVI